MPAPVKLRPLRYTLSATITVLVVAASLTILSISYFVSEHSLLALANSVTAETSKGIIERLNSLLLSSEQANAAISFMLDEGLLDPSDGRRILNAEAAVVRQNEGVTSVELGLPDGSKYKVAKENDGALTRYSDIRTSANVVRTYYQAADSPHPRPSTVKSLQTGYDARKRPWFTKAVGAGKLTWTDMYVSGTLKQFEYSCAAPIYHRDGTLKAVVSVNTNLVTLSSFLGALKILEHGRAFIMNDRDQVIAVPIKSPKELDQLFKPSTPGSEEPFQLYGFQELPDPDIRLALTSYRRNEANSFSLPAAGGGENMASVFKYPYRDGSDFTIGIIFPKSDIMGNVSRNTRLMLAGVLLLLILAVWIGRRLATRIARSLAVLSDEVDKVGRLELNSSVVVESRILEVAKIDESVTQMRRGLRSFRKYVPVELVAQLHTLRKEAVLEGERREVSIFFSDIANFASISENLTPEGLVQQLGHYFNALSRIVLDHSGTLDKYIGDAIMAFWGAPLPRENHAALACAAALKCKQFLDRLAAKSKSESFPVFHTRIGIHTGEVIVGNIGSEDRMNYTIIGDPVNLASRLEGLNKFYQTRIIVSEETFRRAQNGIVARKLDLVAVKGKSQGVLIYELISTRGELDPAMARFLQFYDRAVELYMGRCWEEAREAFAAAQTHSPRGNDYPSELLSARCDALLQEPPGPDWNGVFVHQSK